MQTILKIDNYEAFHELFADLDKNIKLLEQNIGVSITASNEGIVVEGEKENLNNAIRAINLLINDYQNIDRQKIEYVSNMINESEPSADDHLKQLSSNLVFTTYRGKSIKPKTIGQNRYIKTINSKELVFGIGPAGTGKTFLAVAMAIKHLKNNSVQRIIITRPAVEAGESLGFLPGDLQMKVDPYLRPIYDAMYDILGMDNFIALKEKGIIEIAPLAYMRGRTLDNAFVILDEAQNTTREQMKMFLTRFGAHSRVVVNGDISQIDLPRGKKSGLTHALRVLKGINEIGFVHFSELDVVRHSLVKKIISCYNKYSDSQKEGEKRGNNA